MNRKPERLAEPAGLESETEPEVPLPTTAVIWVAEFTVKLAAAVPPKPTEVTPKRLVPVMIMVEPAAPLTGVKDVMVGGATTVKDSVELAINPPQVVTVITPFEVGLATVAVAVICVSVLAVILAVVPPMVTLVALLRFVPFMVKLCAPARAVAGVKLVMVGAAT
jgi:hypothetical protein